MGIFKKILFCFSIVGVGLAVCFCHAPSSVSPSSISDTPKSLKTPLRVQPPVVGSTFPEGSQAIAVDQDGAVYGFIPSIPILNYTFRARTPMLTDNNSYVSYYVRLQFSISLFIKITDFSNSRLTYNLYSGSSSSDYFINSGYTPSLHLDVTVRPGSSSVPGFWSTVSTVNTSRPFISSSSFDLSSDLINITSATSSLNSNLFVVSSLNTVPSFNISTEVATSTGNYDLHRVTLGSSTLQFTFNNGGANSDSFVLTGAYSVPFSISSFNGVFNKGSFSNLVLGSWNSDSNTVGTGILGRFSYYDSSYVWGSRLYTLYNSGINFLDGFSDGYSQGYNLGVVSNPGGWFSSVGGFLSGIFNSIGSIFSIQVFGGISIGTLLAIPLIFAVILFVLKHMGA